MNNLEKNSKIEIRTDGRKSYDIILKDSFDDFLKQMEFLEIEHKKICIVTTHRPSVLDICERVYRINKTNFEEIKK